jgi:hypothetical protein
MTCTKCCGDGHSKDECKLSIRIPYHVKIDWTCQYCLTMFESLTPAFDHEDWCSVLNPSISLINRIDSHLLKK